MDTLETKPAKPTRQGKWEQIYEEIRLEREESREQERLYQEQQTALGNPPRAWRLPTINPDEEADETPDEPYSVIEEWCERRKLLESREQWDIAVYLVMHCEFESRQQMNLRFEKPKDSKWASAVLTLMIKQHVLSAIEVEFLVSRKRRRKPTDNLVA